MGESAREALLFSKNQKPLLLDPPSSLLPRREVPNSSWWSFSRAGQLFELLPRKWQRYFLPTAADFF